MNRKKRSTFSRLLRLAFAALCILALLAACTDAAGVLPQTGQEQAAGEEVNQALLWRTLPGGRGQELVAIDLDSGRPVEGMQPLEVGHESNYAYSPDRNEMAIYWQGAGCPYGCLQLYKLATLEERAAVELRQLDGIITWVPELVYSPQGDRLAMVYQAGLESGLVVLDLAESESIIVLNLELDIQPRKASFTGDGRRLMVIGSAYSDENERMLGINPQPQALLIDLSKSEVAWKQELSGLKDGMYGSGDHSKPEENVLWQAGIAADPASGRMYIAHPDAERLTTVDFEQRQVHTADVRPRQSPLEDLIERLLSIGARPAQAKAINATHRRAWLAPDGRSLYVTRDQNRIVSGENGSLDFVYETSGVQIWDVRSAGLSSSLDIRANDVRPGPNGALLFTGYDETSSGGQPWTVLFDPAAREVIASRNGVYTIPVMRLDGRLALVTSDYTDGEGQSRLTVLDKTSLEDVIEWEDQDGAYSYWLEFWE